MEPVRKRSFLTTRGGGCTSRACSGFAFTISPTRQFFPCMRIRDSIDHAQYERGKIISERRMGRVCEDDRNIVQDVTAWLERRRLAANVKIERKPIAQLRGWTIEPASGNLAHQSGKFFQIAGLEVKTNFGGVGHWTQPIIFQREVGLIGFLSKRIGGALHLLVQAKMEPGNINLVQLSPTVQATRSNFTQVHGGERPRYLEYFLNCRLEDITVDQLQSEQGSK